MRRLDAAALFLAALESAPARSRPHAIDDEGIPFRAIAEAIGERLGLPAVSLSPEEAAGHFEWPDFFAGADLPASGTLTAERFGRHPERPGLLADLAAGQCFRIPA